MYKKDLSQIKSTHLLDELKNRSKKYWVSPAFYAALADLYPELEEENVMKHYKISWTKSTTTLSQARVAASRGRDNSTATST
jgi:hypothetical protein